MISWAVSKLANSSVSVLSLALLPNFSNGCSVGYICTKRRYLQDCPALEKLMHVSSLDHPSQWQGKLQSRAAHYPQSRCHFLQPAFRHALTEPYRSLEQCSCCVGWGCNFWDRHQLLLWSFRHSGERVPRRASEVCKYSWALLLHLQDLQKSQVIYLLSDLHIKSTAWPYCLNYKNFWRVGDFISFLPRLTPAMLFAM